jgi:hypothetical protein
MLNADRHLFPHQQISYTYVDKAGRECGKAFTLTTL